MTLATRLKFTGIAGAAAALIAILGFATLATAAVAPTVTLTVRNSAETIITSANIGEQVHAKVEVASTSATTSPTGTVNFSWYEGQSCSGSATTQNGVSLDSNGIATSSAVSVPAGGLSYKAHYNGQTDVYTEADSACVSVDTNDSDTALSLSLSNNNVTAGSNVYAIPSLTGETSGADGTIQYRVYSNNTCTNEYLNAGSKTVTNSSTPNSDSFQFNTAGTYYWRGVYSGDADNEAATSSCTGAVLTVGATSTPPSDTGPNTISGTVFNDLNKNDKQDGGDTGLSGWTVWLHKAGATTTDKKARKSGYNDPIVATATTDSNGNYSFGNLGSGTYFVEEKIEAGWNQTSPDKKVVLGSSNSGADVDFSNVEKNNNNGNGNGHGTSTGNGHGDNDDENDDEEEDEKDENNGNHNGWRNWFNRLNSHFDGWGRGNNDR